MSTISNRKAEDAIAKLQPFRNHTGSLRGTLQFEGNAQYGMTKPDVPTDASYYVYSYDTVIGYVKNGKATVPDEKYSVTTSKHQGIARLGFHYAGLET